MVLHNELLVRIKKSLFRHSLNQLKHRITLFLNTHVLDRACYILYMKFAKNTLFVGIIKFLQTGEFHDR